LNNDSSPPFRDASEAIAADARTVAGGALAADTRTVASEAIAAGEPGIGRSFRFHRPRGPVCASGHCAQCEIVTPSGRALACRLPATEAAALSRPRRGGRLLGRAAELVNPWFYERRFLRPRFLRRTWLRILRHLSAAPGLAPAPPARRDVRRYVERSADVVVVGAADGYPAAVHVRPDRGDTIVGVYPGRVLGLIRGDELIALRFERLVLATGAYERLPPIPGCDLPGVFGVDAFERYARQGAIRPRSRIAVWAPAEEHWRMRLLAEQTRSELVWLGDRAPKRISGRGRVSGIDVDRHIQCDYFLTGVRQPALDLALQAGAVVRLTDGELPVLVLADKPDWIEVIGEAAAQRSRVPDVPPAGDAVLCMCEDVRASDIRACVAQGFDSAELLKRRTGAMTGPCQGKMCAAAVLAELRDAGAQAAPTRARPLARPVTLGELAADA
jgi:bacterioferritin-associated ferredoxin